MRYQIELTSTDKRYMRVVREFPDSLDALAHGRNLAARYFSDEYGINVSPSCAEAPQEHSRSVFADAAALLAGLVLLNHLFDYFGM